jgi:hypothetical protein
MIVNNQVIGEQFGLLMELTVRSSGFRIAAFAYSTAFVARPFGQG